MEKINTLFNDFDKSTHNMCTSLILPPILCTHKHAQLLWKKLPITHQVVYTDGTDFNPRAAPRVSVYVCLSDWVCESYIVHHLNGTGLSNE